MEKLKRKRTTQRAAFSRALSAFSETQIASTDKRTILLSFQVLEEAMHELSITTNDYLDLLCETPEIIQEIIDEEYTHAEDYKKRFLEAKFSVVELQSKIPAAQTSRRNSIAVSTDTKRTYKLPKIELVKFGDVREWLHFWSTFKKIHEDPDIIKEDKFQYLKQATVANSRAEILVKSFPPTAENYEKVIDSLKNRFGREDLQIEVYVRELLQLVLKNAISQSKTVVLSSLYDKLESYLRSLDSLGITTDKCATMLFPLVESSLPEELLRAWQRSNLSTSKEANVQAKDRLSQLVKFLEGEVQNEVRISMAVKGFDLKSTNEVDKQKKDKERNTKDTPSAASLLSVKGQKKQCVFCESSDHTSAVCDSGKKMTYSQRKEIAKKKNCCFKCLNIGHTSFKCRVFLNCDKCSRRHVTLMCPGDEKQSDSSSETAKKECNLASFCNDPEVFMQTLRVKLFNDHREMIVRAVIDSGSQRSYIIKEAVNKMGYEPIAEQMVSHSLFGGEKSGAELHKGYLIRLRSLDDNYACNFRTLDQSVICDDVPSVKNGIWVNELKNLDVEITDIKGNELVSVLIGADVAGKLFTGKRHMLECGLVAMETYLGWTLMGSVPSEQKRKDAVLIATNMFARDANISGLWSLDVLGIKDPIEIKSQKEREREIKEKFLSSVKFTDEERYSVKLPWLENHPPLNGNKGMAFQWLQNTVKKLKSDGYYDDYGAVFDEWVAEKIIERVPDEEKDKWVLYLPHRPVVKENSTTKIRPVYDASAKERDFPSLNDCLEKGPNLIETVSSILLRFREGNIGVISDIKKAFLQIGIGESDRDFLRFLWYDEYGNEIIFRHCRVVFGVSSSPFILGAIIEMHLSRIIESLKSTNDLNFQLSNIVKLMNTLYVDNCAASVNSKEQLDSFISDAKAAMEMGGFDLRGWEYSKDNSRENQVAVLGLIWDKQSDTLALNVPVPEKLLNEKITKRNILSITHKIYDPLGFASPVVLCPRLLLQETWALKLSWDEEVNKEIKEKFIKWVSGLKDLNMIQIPRCFLGEEFDAENISIHTFCDASKSAYAAVVFLRVENASGVKVHFVQSKSRVAPIKGENSDSRTSIPRLELLAANIGVRLTNSVVESLNFKNVPIYYWTDSSTVLAWVYRGLNWSTFVWNRIKEILKYSSPKEWRLVF